MKNTSKLYMTINSYDQKITKTVIYYNNYKINK